MKKAPKLSELIDPDSIKNLEATTKAETLEEMVALIGRSPRVTDVDAYRDAILAREQLTSTGIGLSVAIPHVKIPSVTDYVIAVGRCASGVDFDSLDGVPVKLVFMVGASDRQAIDFVQMLARIVNLIKDEATRTALLEADSPEAVCAVIADAEK